MNGLDLLRRVDAIKVLKEVHGVKELGAVEYCFGTKVSSQLLDISQARKLEERIY